jgi:hypothetical protein
VYILRSRVSLGQASILNFVFILKNNIDDAMIQTLFQVLYSCSDKITQTERVYGLIKSKFTLMYHYVPNIYVLHTYYVIYKYGI